MQSDQLAPSRLAAASLGAGIGALLGVMLSLIVGTYAGAGMTQIAAAAVGIGFLIGLVMIPVALGLGIAAKVRRAQPGWWSTLGVLLALFASLAATVVFINLPFAA